MEMNMEMDIVKRRVLLNSMELKESIKTQRDDNNLQLGFLIESFQTSLKEDWLYCCLSKGTHFASHPDYTESFYSDLSVTPVDLVVVYLKLELPSAKDHNFQIDSWVDDACYAHLTDKSAGTSAGKSAGKSTAEEDSSRLRDQFYEKIYNCMKDIFFEDTYLIPSKVMTWFNNLVESTIESYNRNRAPSLRIRNRETSTDCSIVYQINIQGRVLYFTLVPVIDCIMTIHPDRRDQRVINFESSKAILVPKPYDFRKRAGAANLTAERVQSIERLWLVNMYEAERIILSIAGNGCAKKVIKLLKMLRKKERWYILSKYCLKTIVMLMIIRNPDPQEWSDFLLFFKLIEALRFLVDSLDSRSLDYCFGLTNMFQTIESKPLFKNDKYLDIVLRLNKVILIIINDGFHSIAQLRDAFSETQIRDVFNHLSPP